MPRLNIVMVEPEIPQNTGNVARTCAATGARLHLVGPMGFTIDDKKLKRAGLDYWKYLDITYYNSLAEFFEKNKVFWEGCCHEKLPPFNLFDVSPQIVEHEWNNALLCVKRAFY